MNGIVAVGKCMISEVCGKEHEAVGMSFITGEHNKNVLGHWPAPGGAWFCQLRNQECVCVCSVKKHSRANGVIYASVLQHFA